MDDPDDSLRLVTIICDDLSDRLPELALLAEELIGTGEVDPAAARELHAGMKAVESRIGELAHKFDLALENR